MPNLRIEISPALADAIRAKALAAFPRECCGLLEGVRQEGNFHVTALHPARNVCPAPHRFEMDARDQFLAQKGARQRGRSIIGCYHSHPGGPAQPSSADRDGAGEEEFLWLIAGSDGLKAFIYREGEFDVLSLGADWVTSSR